MNVQPVWEVTSPENWPQNDGNHSENPLVTEKTRVIATESHLGGKGFSFTIFKVVEDDVFSKDSPTNLVEIPFP